MQKTILWVLAVVIVGGGWFLYSSKGNTPSVAENDSTGTQEVEGTAGTAMPVPGAGPVAETVVSPAVPDVVIMFTDAGFAPSSVTVKKGQTVRWANNSGSTVWPASAVHPSHAVYPQKSASDCLGSSFDACKGLAQGESWDFKFDYAGEWKYHNHLNGAQKGAVTVTE
ncbi:MAG: hypothetical protein NUV88_00590 [Candidatus Kaiserbacteria bacterium]|nr:hypothetical protein [Candidatus Kaiserbacteria bacterium]